MTAPDWLLQRTQSNPTEFPVFDAPARAPGIPLDLNESYWFWNDELLNMLRSTITANTVGTYPDYTTLYSELSAYTDMPSECLCLTNGSDQSIGFLLSLLCANGGTAIIPAPTFLIYPHIVRRAGIQALFVPHAEEEEVCVFPLEETLRAIHTAENPTLFLCNPNNPLGASIPPKILDTILAACAEAQVPVVIDEAYFEYHTDTRAKSILQHDTVIVLRSFSKGFGMPGVRLGYTIADPAVIHTMKSAKLPWNVNHFAVHAGILALQQQPYFAEKRAEVHAERAALVEVLMQKGCAPLPSLCNFVTVPHAQAKEITAQLAKEHVYVKHIAAYPHGGSMLQNALRIAVPSPNDRTAVHAALLRVLP